MAKADYTVSDCIDRAADILGDAGVDAPRAEARLLLAHAMGVGKARLIADPDRVVTDFGGFLELVERRARRVPMAQVIGSREFWGLNFRVTPDTLDPRPDSELLVEKAIEILRWTGSEAPILLDLGTGTGCLLLAVLSELPGARGVGVDISVDTLAVARENAVRLHLVDRAQFVAGDWGAALGGPFDLILANPPYVGRAAIARLQPEITRYEPRGALDGGSDGLACYRRLAPGLADLLAPCGFVVLEIGSGRSDAVREILTAAGLRYLETTRDLAGFERCQLFQRR